MYHSHPHGCGCSYCHFQRYEQYRHNQALAQYEQRMSELEQLRRQARKREEEAARKYHRMISEEIERQEYEERKLRDERRRQREKEEKKRQKEKEIRREARKREEKRLREEETRARELEREEKKRQKEKEIRREARKREEKLLREEETRARELEREAMLERFNFTIEKLLHQTSAMKRKTDAWIADTVKADDNWEDALAADTIQADDILSKAKETGAKDIYVAKRPRKDTIRKNQSLAAEYDNYDLENPFSSGSFRWVAKGTYTTGLRKGEPCVCKWFKKGSGAAFEEEFFAEDIKTSAKAASIIEKFNASGFVDKLIRVNEPEVWEFDPDPDGFWTSGVKVLQEPFITNYKKFNSNSGWKDDSTPWPRVMQALSHYSYHITNGQYLLCDLQGGVYSNGIVLTDPAIISRTKTYGVTDLGLRGISSFFSRHECNEYCRSNWRLPRDKTNYFPAKQGTSMMSSSGSSVLGSYRHVPTVDSRLPLSVLGSSITTTNTTTTATTTTTAVPSVGKMGGRHMGFNGLLAASAFIPLGTLAESEEEEEDSDSERSC